MEKQIKSSKLSKILIITSIAASVTLSGAFLIYKHNKENKQYKRNSHSNFSITIHLSKDNLKSDGVQDISIDKNKIKGKEKSIEENELSEIQDFDEYISSLPSSEEKNFFLSLFDKFMNIFSKKEDLLDDTIIITKPNEALYSLSDSVEIDENNDTIIITKTNEADGIPNIDDNNYNTKDNVKILNEVIEQTINLVNNNNNSNNNSSNNNGSDIDNDNDNDSAVDSSSSTGTTTTTTTTTGNNRKNFKKSITITSLDNSIGSKNSNGTNPTVNNYYNEPVSAQSSTSTLIGKRENLENLQNSSSSFYNSNSMKNMMSEIEMEDVIETGDEGDAEDELEHDDDDNDDEYHNNYTNTNTNTNTGKHFTYRKRKETITSSNYNKRNDEFIDSENEYVAPSTPKMSFTERHSLSPLFSNNNNNNSNNNNNKNNNSNSNSNNNNNSNSSTSNTSHTNYSNTSNINRTPKVDKLEKSDRIDNESINPLSIDINQLLMETQDFEFSDEEDGSNTPSDTIDIIRSNGKTLHRASSISSTSTFQSAKSSWTDGQSLMEENIMGHESINTTNKEQVLLNTNDENWEVNSACSSTSGFYSAQEEFYDA